MNTDRELAVQDKYNEDSKYRWNWKKQTASWFLVVITMDLITFNLQQIDTVMDGCAKFMLIKLKVLVCHWRNSILRPFQEWLRFPMAQKLNMSQQIWLLYLSI